jgi:hypothetical protein
LCFDAFGEAVGVGVGELARAGSDGHGTATAVIAEMQTASDNVGIARFTLRNISLRAPLDVAGTLWGVFLSGARASSLLERARR